MIRAPLWLALVIGLTALGPAPAQAAAPTASAASPAAGQVLVLLRMPPTHARSASAFASGYGPGAQQATRRRIATRLAHEHGLTLVTGWPMPLVGVDCFVMSVAAGQSPAEVAVELSRDRDVAWSEPMHAYRAESAAAPPNDPLFRAQPAAQAWRLADLHEIATGRNVRVAVVDSAIDTRHPDLVGQVRVLQDFAPDHPGLAETHGTGVAGIIAALADNHVGIAGVAPEAHLMGLRACWQDTASPETVCDTLSLAKALHFAIENRAQVINLSLSGPSDSLLGRLIDVALARGVTVVAAADPTLAQGGFPASHAGVVAVAAERGGGGLARVYVAPGRDVPTTQPGGRWFLVDGSSYSAAHVTGLFALLDQHGGRARGPAALVTQGSSGEIDACASLLHAAAPCHDCACARPPKGPADARP